MKKTLLSVLALTLALSLCACQKEEVNELQYTDDGVLIISKEQAEEIYAEQEMDKGPTDEFNWYCDNCGEMTLHVYDHTNGMYDYYKCENCDHYVSCWH